LTVLIRYSLVIRATMEDHYIREECDVKENLKNNKLDDSTLEKVSGGEGDSVGRSEPRYPLNTIVYCRGYGKKKFYVIRTSYLGRGWRYVLRSYSENEFISGVKEEDLSDSNIF